jgi:hypothetical protein
MSETKAAEPKRSLVKKLAEIMGEVGHVAKNGRNVSQGYDYATEADIAAAVRGGLSKRAVMMIPSVEKTEWSSLPTRSGGSLRLCTLTVKFTLEDGDSGETRSLIAVGEGTDSGDKASYKAMTGAEKYALMKLFLIPTGDDPEKDDKEEAPARQPAPAAQRQRLPAPIGEMPREMTEGERVAAEPQPQMPQEDVSSGEFGPVMPFGKAKGRRASEATADDLSWMIRTISESLNDPSKKKFQASNKKLLDGLLAVREAKFGPYSGHDA